MGFINDRFMIDNEVGVRLYQDIAKDLPIIDYHCHLEAKDIYENNAFEDITQLWLAGDHYKWRAMRANGIDERCITGDASSEEKFQAWAETVEASFGNPLYHWTHLELSHYFDCHLTLDSHNWREVMEYCNRLLRQPDFTPRRLMERSKVEVVCTTDAPLDSLEYHRLLRQDNSFGIKVLPTFRPDDVFSDDPARFAEFTTKLAQSTDEEVKTFAQFSEAIRQRIAWFHNAGCRISDHGPACIDYQAATPERVNALFSRKASAETLTAEDERQLNSAIFVMLAGHYKAFGWAMQIHFGAIRNTNSRMHHRLGINTGFDSINDQSRLASSLNHLFDAMMQENALPKTILYNLNAIYNDIVATTIANFQSAEFGVKSPMQFGSGWWFNDTRRGMENQLNSLADQGLLMHFVGMLTDSRSFVSYTRHDYFRRILCNLIGGWVEKGEVPNNKDILTRMIRNICHDNAKNYFKF
ncbi:glucuronate isomerase [Citrobacter sp. 50677481]|uniref:glucuronate isomerase n=1 Tax=Citrobacter sp. 50677481 TaxID=1736699 RepID=UPI000741F913|nr:glucuronate isomerase [Citrobacter sp. 50677481]KSY31605.1 glucuronate isomerase [Citrobacter sp. 50677481]HCQ7753175.1 glucuronate isomerase [Citrobacter sedlakii]